MVFLYTMKKNSRYQKIRCAYLIWKVEFQLFFARLISVKRWRGNQFLLANSANKIHAVTVDDRLLVPNNICNNNLCTLILTISKNSKSNYRIGRNSTWRHQSVERTSSSFSSSFSSTRFFHFRFRCRRDQRCLPST